MKTGPQSINSSGAYWVIIEGGHSCIACGSMIKQGSLAAQFVGWPDSWLRMHPSCLAEFIDTAPASGIAKYEDILKDKVESAAWLND